MGASDIHIQTENAVFFNVDAGLVKTGIMPTRHEIEDIIKIIVKDEGGPAKLFDKLERDLSYSIATRSGVQRFRVNIALCKTGYYIAMRRIARIGSDPSKIGLPDKLVQIATSVPYGIVFVVGPTGSGKSTTLATLTSYMAEQKARNIVTIEDPVEYDIVSDTSHVVQREVGRETLSFRNAIRAAMRERPNILLIGEIRDPDTAEAALQIAKSGHLVLTTMHAKEVTQIPQRVASMFKAEHQPWILNELMENMVAGVAQTLVLTADGRRRLVTEFCDTTSEDVRQLMCDNKTQKVREIMRKGDVGWTMNSHLAALLRSGIIGAESALSSSNDIDEMRGIVSALTG